MALVYILIIIASILTFIKIFSGEIILERNAELGSIDFQISKPGFYGIWIEGKLFKSAALDRRNAKINKFKNEEIKPIRSLFRPHVNGFRDGRVLLKYYYLKKGKYTFEIVGEEEDSLSWLSKLLMQNIPSNKSTEFNYQLRKTVPEFIFPILIAGIVLSLLKLIEII